MDLPVVWRGCCRRLRQQRWCWVESVVSSSSWQVRLIHRGQHHVSEPVQQLHAPPVLALPPRSAEVSASTRPAPPDDCYQHPTQILRCRQHPPPHPPAAWTTPPMGPRCPHRRLRHRPWRPVQCGQSLERWTASPWRVGRRWTRAAGEFRPSSEWTLECRSHRRGHTQTHLLEPRPLPCQSPCTAARRSEGRRRQSAGCHGSRPSSRSPWHVGVPRRADAMQRLTPHTVPETSYWLSPVDIHTTLPVLTYPFYTSVTRLYLSPMLAAADAGVQSSVASHNFVHLSVCQCCKMKPTWAINTKLGIHSQRHGRTSACVDTDVKKSKVKMMLPAWICRSMSLLGFLIVIFFSTLLILPSIEITVSQVSK